MKCANFYSFRLGLMLYYYIVPLKFNVYKNHHLILQYESIRFIVKLYQKFATIGPFWNKKVQWKWGLKILNIFLHLTDSKLSTVYFRQNNALLCKNLLLKIPYIMSSQKKVFYKIIVDILSLYYYCWMKYCQRLWAMI